MDTRIILAVVVVLALVAIVAWYVWQMRKPLLHPLPRFHVKFFGGSYNGGANCQFLDIPSGPPGLFVLAGTEPVSVPVVGHRATVTLDSGDLMSDWAEWLNSPMTITKVTDDSVYYLLPETPTNRVLCAHAAVNGVSNFTGTINIW